MLLPSVAFCSHSASTFNAAQRSGRRIESSRARPPASSAWARQSLGQAATSVSLSITPVSSTLGGPSPSSARSKSRGASPSSSTNITSPPWTTEHACATNCALQRPFPSSEARSRKCFATTSETCWRRRNALVKQVAESDEWHRYLDGSHPRPHPWTTS